MSILSQFNISHRILFALLIIGTAFAYALVPLDQELPVHWNIYGQADSFAAALYALAGPLVIALLIGLIFVLTDKKLMSVEESLRSKSIMSAAFSAILVLSLVILVCLILIGRGEIVDAVRIIVLGLLGMLALIANYLPKSQPNRFAGLRIASTLADQDNWRISHLWLGRAMFVMSVASFVAVLFGPPPWLMFACVFATVMLPVVLATLISLNMARQR